MIKPTPELNSIVRLRYEINGILSYGMDDGIKIYRIIRSGINGGSFSHHVGMLINEQVENEL